MTWFTAGTVKQAITTDTFVGLVGSATTTGSAFGLFERWARSDVKAALQVAGYTPGDTTTNDTVIRLAIARWCMHANGTRKGMEIPPTIREDLYRLDQVRTGDYPIPGLTPDSEDAIGGSKFSVIASNATNSTARYFKPGSLKGF